MGEGASEVVVAVVGDVVGTNGFLGGGGTSLSLSPKAPRGRMTGRSAADSVATRRRPPSTRVVPTRRQLTPSSPSPCSFSEKSAALVQDLLIGDACKKTIHSQGKFNNIFFSR